MGNRTATPEPKACPKKRTPWRSWGEAPGEDVVMLPRSLALDLVKALGVSHFLHAEGLSDDDLEAGLHNQRLKAHRQRIGAIEENVCAHLCDEGLPVTAETVLRALAIAYEAAPLVMGGEA